MQQKKGSMEESKEEDNRRKLRERLRKQREERQRGHIANVGKASNLEGRAEQALSARGLDPTMLLQLKHQMTSTIKSVQERNKTEEEEEEEEAPPPSEK